MNFLMMETLKNLEAYLGETGCPMYRKLAGSSEGAIWEREEYLADLRLTDMTPEGPIDYALLRLYPGISVPEAYRAQVVQYIQNYMVTDIGGLVVDDEHGGDLIYSVQTPMIENAITAETFRTMESFAAQLLRKHLPALEALAGGNLPDSLPTQNTAPVPEDKLGEEQIKAFADGIRNYLVGESNHNAISEYTDKNGLPHWRCELYTSSSHYFLDIALHRSGIATVKLRHGARGILVPPAFRRAMARYLNGCSAPRKVGFLWVGNDREGVTDVANISMLDGPIGGKTLHELESILLTAFCRIGDQAAAVARGMAPTEDEGAEERLHKLRGMLPRLPGMPGLLDQLRGTTTDDDEDDDDDGDDDNNGDDKNEAPGMLNRTDFFRRLAELRAARNAAGGDDDDDNDLISGVTDNELPF